MWEYSRHAALFLFIILLSWGVYGLISERKLLQEDITGLQEKLDSLEEENTSLTTQISYLEDPRNLLKEAKSQFHFRESGEKLIVIVPDTATSSGGDR